MRRIYKREFHKKRAAIIFNDAFALIAERDHQGALVEFERAFELDSTVAEYAYYAGLSSYSLDKEKASYYFEQASSIEEENAKYRMWQGISYYDQKKYKEAKQVLLYAYTINAEEEQVRMYLTKTMNKLNEHEQVIEFVENIHTMKPITAEELFELGYAYMKEYRLIDAIHSFQRSIKRNDKHKVSYYLLSQTYCKTGEFDKAIDTMNELKVKCPEETDMIREQIRAIELLQSF